MKETSLGWTIWLVFTAWLSVFVFREPPEPPDGSSHFVETLLFLSLLAVIVVVFATLLYKGAKRFPFWLRVPVVLIQLCLAQVSYVAFGFIVCIRSAVPTRHSSGRAKAARRLVLR